MKTEVIIRWIATIALLGIALWMVSTAHKHGGKKTDNLKQVQDRADTLQRDIIIFASVVALTGLTLLGTEVWSFTKTMKSQTGPGMASPMSMTGDMM